MFTDVKAARSITWLARGYQDGSFTLSLTVTLTLCCCSVPVSVACVWRRPHTADVAPLRITPTEITLSCHADHGFHSRTRLCQNCHFTTGIAFGAHIYLIRIDPIIWSILRVDLVIWSMFDCSPLANMGFRPYYVIYVVLGMIFFDDHSLTSPPCGRRGRLVHVLKFVRFRFCF